MGYRTFEIETGIPIPPRAVYRGSRGRGNWAYPFHELEIGQSFFVEGDGPATAAKVRPAFSAAGKRLNKKFVSRIVHFDERTGKEGVRVWRVE